MDYIERIKYVKERLENLNTLEGIKALDSILYDAEKATVKTKLTNKVEPPKLTPALPSYIKKGDINYVTLDWVFEEFPNVDYFTITKTFQTGWSSKPQHTETHGWIIDEKNTVLPFTSFKINVLYPYSSEQFIISREEWKKMKASTDYFKYRGQFFNFRNPKTDLDHLVLAMALWWDIANNDLKEKNQSRYYKFVEPYLNECPCCAIYVGCEGCPLEPSNACSDGSYTMWCDGMATATHSKTLYKTIKKEADRLIDKSLGFQREEQGTLEKDGLAQDAYASNSSKTFKVKKESPKKNYGEIYMKKASDIYKKHNEMFCHKPEFYIDMCSMELELIKEFLKNE